MADSFKPDTGGEGAVADSFKPDSFKPDAPARPKRNEAMGGPPPGYTAPPMDRTPAQNVPLLLTPWVRGFEQAQQGYDRAKTGDVAGGTSDMVKGGLTAGSPIMLGGAARAIGQGIMNVGARYIVPRAIGGILGGGAATVAGDQGGQYMADQFGASPGVKELTGTTTGLITGALGGIYGGGAKLTREPGNLFPRVQMRTAPMTEYPEAPFMRAVPSRAEDALETWQTAVPELRATRDAQGIPLTEVAKNWKGPQGSFTKYLSEEVGPAAKARFWGTYDQLAAPFRGRLRLNGNELASSIQGAVKDNAISGPVSNYTQNLVANYQGKSVPMEVLEAELHQVNGMLSGFYNKSGAAAKVAIIQDANDVAAMEALARNIRQQLYSGLDSENGGALAADAMRRFGRISEVSNWLAAMKNDAIKGLTPSTSERAAQLGLAALQAKAGFTGSAMSRVGRMLGRGEETIDNALLKAFQGYEGTRIPIEIPRGPSPEEVLQSARVPQRLSNAELANRIAYQPPVGLRPTAQQSAEVLIPGGKPYSLPLGKSAAASAQVFAESPSQVLPGPLARKSAAESAALFEMFPSTRSPVPEAPVSPQHPMANMPLPSRGLPMPQTAQYTQPHVMPSGKVAPSQPLMGPPSQPLIGPPTMRGAGPIQMPQERPSVSMDFVTEFARENKLDFVAAAAKLKGMGYRLPVPFAGPPRATGIR